MVKGGCHCGAIEFEVNEQIEGGVLCHCQTCQKLHSNSSYNAKSTVDAIKVTKGTPKVYDDKGADGGKIVHRSFCGDCSSALFSAPDSMPGVAFVKIGSLENANSIKPVAEIYVDTGYPFAPLDKKQHGTKHFEGMMAKEV